MKRRVLILAALAAVAVVFFLAPIALLGAGCTPERPPNDPPAPPPTERDGIGTELGDACARLRRIGCPEGWPNRRGRTCFESYTSAAELAIVPATCLKASATEHDVRGCGNANTIRVRCVLPTADVAGSTAP